MIVDTGAVWGSICDPEHRSAEQLDVHFCSARLGDAGDIEAHDEWVGANLVPPAYQALLDRNEEENQRKYPLKKLQQKVKAAKKAAKRTLRGAGMQQAAQ